MILNPWCTLFNYRAQCQVYLGAKGIKRAITSEAYKTPAITMATLDLTTNNSLSEWGKVLHNEDLAGGWIYTRDNPKIRSSETKELIVRAM